MNDFYIGQKFGERELISLEIKRDIKNWYLKVRCTCGSEEWVVYRSLAKSKSCPHNRINNIPKGLIPHNKLPDGISSLNSLYGNYKRNASHRGIGFSLSIDDFKTLTKEPCYYCGVQPSKKFPTDHAVTQRIKIRKGKLTQYVYNGLDRKDNSLPYEPGNAVSCCEQCNYMKSDYSENEFLKKVAEIYLKLKGAL